MLVFRVPLAPSVGVALVLVSAGCLSGFSEIRVVRRDAGSIDAVRTDSTAARVDAVQATFDTSDGAASSDVSASDEGDAVQDAGDASDVLSRGDARVGEQCVSSAECMPGWFCQDAAEGWPGGYCTREGCNGDGECGVTGTCVAGTPGSVCFARCASATDCRGGYSCARISIFDPTGLCLPRCSTNVPVLCREYACNVLTELCTGGCSTSRECSTGSECFAGTCYCTALTNCGPNRRCYSSNGRCGCASDMACGPESRCDLITGGCVRR